MVDTTDKYWICSCCGNVYPSPCYYKPPAECGFNCTPYADGKGFRPHRWQEISRETYYKKLEEMLAAREAARKQTIGCLLTIVIIVAIMVACNSIGNTSRNTEKGVQQQSKNSSSNAISTNNSTQEIVISNSKLEALLDAFFSCRNYKAVRGSQSSVLVNNIKNSGFDLILEGNRTFLNYLKDSFQSDGIYLNNANNNSVLIIKPTFEGYESYEYKKSSGISDKQHIATYNCGSFNLNSRYYFLKEKPVTTDFTNLYSVNDLKLIRNSIFAAHGYVFKSEDLTNYFRKFPWYDPHNNSLDDYTDYEKSNIKFIKKIEDELKQ